MSLYQSSGEMPSGISPFSRKEKPMEDKNEIVPIDQRLPDGSFDMKLGQTTYKVKVFFDHEGQMSAEDRLKRVIQEEALKQTG